MLFNSFAFVGFFLIVYSLYAILRHRAQNVLLLVASYFFYGCWDWRFLSLIFASTVVDYLCGIRMSEAGSARSRRAYLLLSLATNLGMLGVFKYFGFFGESLVALLGTVGLEPDVRFVQIILPVGISFYTFQTLSYTIDIYRGQLAPTRDFLNFAVFVAFFPQLVAGPIERAAHLLPQVEKARRITYDMVREGAWLILLGYFKKVVLADNLAPFSQQMFDHPDRAHGLAVLVGVYAFALQIYGDFSGYSDIARGISRLMGFDIMLNFRMPYLATNPSDFWRRWHISLSTWLRDYLYIPLGGNRGGTWRTYRNLMLTMLLGGLWHGAAWHFVAWGAFHGGILCAHRVMTPMLAQLTPGSEAGRRLWRGACVVGFFHVTCIGWLLFGVRSLADVPTLMGNLFDPLALNGRVALLTLVVFATPMLVLHLFKERSGDMLAVRRWPLPVRMAAYSMVFFAIVFCGSATRHEFIYFQF